MASMRHELLILDKVPEGAGEAVRAALDDCSKQHGFIYDVVPFFVGLHEQDDQGVPISTKYSAGCTGHSAGGVLKVKLLWVDDKHRGSGLGREIMTAVDALGRKRGATFATVNTFSFQAEGFYKKCGYDVLYRVPGCFDGSVEKIFLGKKL
ncbi:hypothetical protein IE81DRAFT_320701 [Ceraceosorus guamensis]|uniref:N-acetyltransferase domain-containing protein n=1 Tax=Ceraceosorus guamensis TaxID=1522189 RepID=A0A316W7I7_9BASI|nr:hypothetical protein IE81DRAFT_320701 [Ceraceosorus guamensis]PWN45098.1 hypothetical protein IE81DRAFT_320701 [Ceraceosorus guamensis]